VVANLDWSLHQFDVKNGFLHGDIEEVYMEVHLGLEDSSSMGKGCKLKKALYGLKQSLRAWSSAFPKLCRDLITKKSQANYTLFIKHASQGKVMALIMYVDDIVVT
jgi:hypothetical protein